MTERQPPTENPTRKAASAVTAIPMLWLFSDRRNDAWLPSALERLPEGSALVFRHYHLEGAARRERFDTLAAIARVSGHCVILSDTQQAARDWGADGIYGPAALEPCADLIRLAAAHNGDELQAANRAQVDGVFLSPVFATASHPGATSLGAMGFSVLAQQSLVPVIALGGMTHARATQLDWPRWGAIDGLSRTNSA